MKDSEMKDAIDYIGHQLDGREWPNPNGDTVVIAAAVLVAGKLVARAIRPEMFKPGPSGAEKGKADA